MGPHRLPAPSSLARGRAVCAAVAFGAIAAATAGQSLLPHHSHQGTTVADPSNTSALIGTNADSGKSLTVPPISRPVDAAAEAKQLTESRRIAGQPAIDNAANQNATNQNATSQPVVATAAFAAPCKGTVVSTFGGQYGTFRYGIEIRGGDDTPVVAAADGVIIAAGPTSGFGTWVKEQLTDGTTLVYARLDDIAVGIGQHVAAGQHIAVMGDNGFNNGYTLHFEVWDPSGKKIDPLAWLNERGITV